MKKIIISIFLFICGHAYSACDHLGFENKLPTSKVQVDVLCKQRYAVGFSAKYKVSLWAAEVLYKENLLKPEVRRSDDFQLDPSIKSNIQARLIMFRNSGYDRGHLVPFENVADDEQAARESFYLTNIVPQDPTHNRGVWKSLENRARKIALIEKKVFVITGILINKQQSLSLKDGTIVPSALWKIIIVPDKKTYDAYLIPNVAGIKAVELNKFRVTIQNIEEKAELNIVDNKRQLKRLK